MYLSKKLISNFFPKFFELTEKEISDIFNSLGIEVESIFNFEKTNNLVVGEILEVEKHKNADSLNVCKVRISNKKINTIVCGAKNVFANQKVIVALKGTKLFDGKVIDNREVRGIMSEGMICAYGELTSRSSFMNKDELDDIIVLPSKVEVGEKDPLSLINLDDTIYDLSIPSNRNELNSIFGIIFELESFLSIKKDLSLPSINKAKKSDVKIINNLSKNNFLIKVKNNDYSTSNWIVKSYIMNSGIVPSNSIEDLEKLNKILTGVPSLVLSNIKTKKLEVVKLKKPEIVTLSKYGKTKLEKDDLVLMDGTKIVALMNIDVVEDYSINHKSNEIYFIFCLLDPLSIRKTANRLKIMNESIKLSNKNISSWWYKKALDLFIKNLLPKFNPIFIDYKYFENKTNKIKFDFKKVNELLATKINLTEVKSILKNFDYKIEGEIVHSPEYRIDVENDHDIIEDILKVKGIHNSKEEMINNSIINFNDNHEIKFINKINNLLINRGFYLIKSYNLTSKNKINEFNFFNYKKPIKILNPISSDREYMKLSLMENILDCYSYNESFKNRLFPIFEIQDVYYENSKKKHLIISIANDIEINSFNKSNLKSDIFALKSILETIASSFNKELYFEKSVDNLWACPKDSLNIFLNKNKIGYITRINVSDLKKNKIKNEKIYVAEINITDFIKENKKNKLIENNENKHKIIRELSIIIPKEYDLNSFYKLSSENELIKELVIIDSFEKDDEISYSIRFNLVSSEKDIKENFDKVIDFYKRNKFKINE